MYNRAPIDDFVNGEKAPNSIQIDCWPVRHFENGGPANDQFVCWENKESAIYCDPGNFSKLTNFIIDHFGIS